jgi:oligoendopeptidase F
MKKINALPKRSDVPESDQWNLASLYPSDTAWNKDFDKWSKQIGGYAKFRGKLGASAKTLAASLNFDCDFDRTGERLGTYAFLKTSEDQANSDYQRMKGRYQHVATQASEAASYMRPEIMAIPEKTMGRFLKSKELAEWKIALEQILRFRPFTLGKKEEQLLAMQGQMSEASNQIFRQLNDADLKWGLVKDEKGVLVELGHSSFSKFLNSPSASVRKTAFHEYYKQFTAHKNTIAATLDASVQRDVYYAKARGYKNAIEKALYATRCR